MSLSPSHLQRSALDGGRSNPVLALEAQLPTGPPPSGFVGAQVRARSSKAQGPVGAPDKEPRPKDTAAHIRSTCARACPAAPLPFAARPRSGWAPPRLSALRRCRFVLPAVEPTPDPAGIGSSGEGYRGPSPGSPLFLK